MRNIILCTALLMAPTTLSSTAPQAEEATNYPYLSGTIDFEIADDNNFDSEDSESEQNDLYATVEGGAGLHFSPALSLQLGTVFEPVRDPDPSEDRVFEDHDLYVEQLFLNYERGQFAFWAGKFNPSFGTAWDIGPGIYGVDFGEDYELLERIGLGGAVTFGATDMGEHRLAVNAFAVDSTSLSRSADKRRARTRHSDGGLGNTRDLGNQSVTLDGSLPGVEGLAYHLGISRQQADDGTTLDESSYVVGISMPIELEGDWGLEFMAEAAFQDQAGGAREDRTYVTAGPTLTYGNWTAALAGAWRSIEPNGGADTDDHMLQFSVGYAFASGLGLNVGYRYGDEGAITTHAIGLRLTYSISGDFPLR